MVEKVFAAIVLAACVVLAVRLLLPARGRYRLDGAVRRAGRALASRSRRAVARPAAERRARREADAAIRRAKSGSWDGNVFRPSSFNGRGGDRKAADSSKRRKNLH